MAIRNVRKIGDPVLNKVCKEVREVNDRIRELIDDMFDTMYEADGVGLAAGWNSETDCRDRCNGRRSHSPY